MRSLILTAAALASATAASAQDTSGETTFNGIYVGGHFGGAFQPNDVGETLVFNRGNTGFSPALSTATGANAFSPGSCNGASRSNVPGNCENDRDNFDYGARIGADTRYGPIVVGVVLEGGRNESLDSVSSFSTTPAGYSLTRDLRFNGNVRGRIGFTPGGETGGILFYATGGAAYGRVRDRFFTTNGANSFATSGTHDAYGYAAGGGTEVMVARNFSLGFEYLYTSLNDKKSRVAVGAGTAPATNPFVLGGTTTLIAPSRNDLNYHNIRVTAAFRF